MRKMWSLKKVPSMTNQITAIERSETKSSTCLHVGERYRYDGFS